MHKKCSGKMKAQVALAALKGDKTLAELSGIYKVHPVTISQWKNEAEKHLHELFEKKDRKKDQKKDQLIEHLYKEVGQREVELEWMKKKVAPFS
jgi:transposase-like protein